jgi:hypothetical protein
MNMIYGMIILYNMNYSLDGYNMICGMIILYNMDYFLDEHKNICICLTM